MEATPRATPGSSLRFARPAIALVRAVSTRLDDCLRTTTEPIDPALARAQHAAYVKVLRELSISVEEVGASEEHPDGCFVEDTAVVTGAHALLTLPGAVSRQREGAEVLPVLARHCQVERMDGLARLDGGDVLRIADVLLVGLSARTNAAGAEALREVAARDGLALRTVTVSAGLHLKSACSLVDASTALLAPAPNADELRAALEACGCEVLDAPEALGGNVLALGKLVLVSAAAPATAALLRSRGVEVIELDVSELHKADGALTCLSLRVPRPGEWSA